MIVRGENKLSRYEERQLTYEVCERKPPDGVAISSQQPPRDLEPCEFLKQYRVWLIGEMRWCCWLNVDFYTRADSCVLLGASYKCAHTHSSCPLCIQLVSWYPSSLGIIHFMISKWIWPPSPSKFKQVLPSFTFYESTTFGTWIVTPSIPTI